MIHKFEVYVTAANLNWMWPKEENGWKIEETDNTNVTKEPRGTFTVNSEVKLELGQTAPSIIVWVKFDLCKMKF